MQAAEIGGVFDSHLDHELFGRRVFDDQRNFFEQCQQIFWECVEHAFEQGVEAVARGGGFIEEDLRRRRCGDPDSTPS